MLDNRAQHRGHMVVHLPMVGRKAEITAESARLFETRYKVFGPRPGQKQVTAELGVVLVTQRKRVNQARSASSPGPEAKEPQPQVVHGGRPIPRLLAGPEGEERP